MRRLVILISMVSVLTVRAQEIISLEGSWDFMVEPDTAGFDYRVAAFNDYVMLPGSMLTNSKGDPVSVKTRWTGSLYDSSYYFNPYMEKYRQGGQMKFPFFLTPERHYVGAAWYRKTVYIPRNWNDRRVTLFLERPHIETKAYVNGHEVGREMSLSTPHRFDITPYIVAGAANEIAIRVYNGIENVCVGQDSHSVTDQTQGNWNGITGRIELQAQWNRLSIEHVKITPDLQNKKVKVEVTYDKHSTVLGSDLFNVRAMVCQMGPGNSGLKQIGSLSQPILSHKSTLIFKYENAQLWDEFQPNLYYLTVQAGDDEYKTTFGLRDITISGRQLYINGRPLYLRGTVENCCFPETGYPPTDKQEWLRIFRKMAEYGLNHVRFHSYCPPEAAFAAADQLGIYLQVEGPSWPNHGVRLRRGQKIDDYLLEESKRIIDEYGHHPSFVMMAAGNEPAGDWVTYCNDWVKQMKAYDPSKIYCGASVGGGWAWDDGSEYHVKGGARGLDWDRRAPSSDDDYFSQIEFPRNYKPLPQSGEDGKGLPNNSPIIAHEQGQWCAFPDFREIKQYTGVYKARNFEIFRDLLRDNGMESMAEKFLMASGKLQVLCYKYEIERNLRTKDYAGVQLLSLNDYSGQGTALVGPLNVFWREKGYVTAEEWSQFCSFLVPLARFPRFVYTSRDTLRVPVEAYNAFSTKVSEVSATYDVTDENGLVVKNGRLSSAVLPMGKNQPLGVVEMALDQVKAPAKLTLHVRFSKDFKNQWDFWVYPEAAVQEPSAPSVVETDDYRKALDLLKQGKTVLLEAAGKVTLGSDVVQHYLPVFWNTSWFKMRPPHTTGAYIDTSHPLFKYDFPTDSWSNLNWWELLNRAQVMNLMELPRDYQSPIQPIDTWHVSRKLGMLVEARVGKGRLLMTTMDLTADLARRHVARQMRAAILSYMQSPDFKPSLTLTPEQVTHFFTRQAPPVNMFTNDSPDELKPKLK